MRKVVLSKTYDPTTRTWTEVYRMTNPPAPVQRDVHWPQGRDVFSATEVAQHYLGTQNICAGDVLMYVRRLKHAGVITPVCGSRLIKINGVARRYYAVRNADKYRTPYDVRRHVTLR